LKLVKILFRKATIIAECSLWLFMFYYAISNRHEVLVKIQAIYELFVLGEGAWGLSVVLLTIITILVLILIKNPKSMTALRFPVTTFMPLMIFIMYLNGTGIRAGVGGSLNRMFIHIIPVVVLFIIMSVAMGELRSYKRTDMVE